LQAPLRKNYHHNCHHPLQVLPSSMAGSRWVV
jgi:hypothetical protein